MNDNGILIRLIMIALICFALGFAFGYERAANDAKVLVAERLK
jgi:hypothetical protein